MDMRDWPRSDRVIFTLMVGALMLAAAAFVAARYRVGIDWQEIPCDDYRVALVDLTQTDAIVGERFSLHPHGLERWFPDGSMLAKQVVAIGGDVVDVSADGVSVNGGPRFAPINPDALVKLGVGMADVSRRYALTDDEVFLYAPSPRSFDSRYYGPVKTTSIAGKVIARW